MKLLISALLLSLSGPLWAQGVDNSMLLNPPADSWPLYHGSYDGQRHSKLEQITPQNVSSLVLAWAFQTHQSAEIKATPLMVDGVLYFSVPDNLWAVDALSGHQIWHYTYPPNHGLHIGNRGVAMYKNWLYFLVPDGHLVSLNAKDGSVRWIVEVADSTKGYWTSMAPLVVGNHVLVGTSGDFDNLVGYVRAVDPETGATQWQWDATPPLGTPSPRPGEDLHTCSIVALNPDTGKMVWAFQPSPHDTHDWDAAETPVLVDGMFHGKPRKMLLQSSRNGYFFVLDRTDGKSLLTVPFGPVDWTLGVDKQGRPIPNPAKEPAPDGRLIAPDEGGMANYRAPSFDPKTGLFIVSAHPSYSIYFAKPADGTYGWAGADYGLWGKGVVEAIDYQTGKIRWTHELGPGNAGSGELTTDPGATFH